MADRQSALAFATVLRRHREAAGISQEGLAERTGLDRTTISMLERGKRRPGLETLLDLGAGLEIPPGVLLDETADLLEKGRGAS
ncbi:MAG: helix-turn-helix transcriptional regulator [bacterium]|nr:helix-turn-helix transcriptional regulator [bacterium]